MEHENDDDTNCNWYRDWRTWKWRLSKLPHCWDRPEYWEESWRPEEACCLSDSCEKLLANAGMKKSQMSYNDLPEYWEESRRLEKICCHSDSCEKPSANYRMSKISEKVINFFPKFMENWKVKLTTGGQMLAEGKIQRGIFQGDSLLPLLFIIAMIPLNYLLRKCKGGYKFTKS